MITSYLFRVKILVYLFVSSVTQGKAQIPNKSNTADGQLYLYQFLDVSSTTIQPSTTTESFPSTTEPTTASDIIYTTDLTPTTDNYSEAPYGPLIYQQGRDNNGQTNFIGFPHKYSGSDEIKVFFRDCKPYMNDCLFGGPVCASDKRTYPNFMFMECINHRRPIKNRVKVFHEGPCWSNPGYGLCPMDPVYDPVCASDNRTYSNHRALDCVINQTNNNNLKIKYRGECIEDGHCFFNKYTWEKPVCVNLGRTLQSYRAARCLRSLDSGVEILHDGPCTACDLKVTLKERAKICHRMRQEVEPFPVCANDGRTYPSAAYVICNKPHLDIEFDRGCNSTYHVACEKAKQLDKEYGCQPVCGSDGKNYNSKYHLICAQMFKSYLTQLHDGPCVPLDSPCVRVYRVDKKMEPVCASDGVTYISPLAMECVTKYKRHGVEFKHMGPCLRSY